MKGFKHKQGIDQYGISGFLECMVFHPCYTLFAIAGESVMESEEHHWTICSKYIWKKIEFTS